MKQFMTLLMLLLAIGMVTHAAYAKDGVDDDSDSDDDDGTEDQGSGDAEGTDSSDDSNDSSDDDGTDDQGSGNDDDADEESSDDDGTADQGSGDAPGTEGSDDSQNEESSDDDGTADQGSGDAPGTESSDDSSVSESEAQKDASAMDTTLGARVRMLQLQRELQRRILHMEAVVEVIENNSNSSNKTAAVETLNEIIADMDDLAMQAKNAAADSSMSKDSALELFLQIKADAKSLVKEFRSSARGVLSASDIATLKNKFENIDKTELTAIKEQIKQLKNEREAERLKLFLEKTGSVDAALVEKVRSGELKLSDARNSVKDRIKALEKGEREALKEKLKESEVKERIEHRDRALRERQKALEEQKKHMDRREEELKERMEKRTENIDEKRSELAKREAKLAEEKAKLQERRAKEIAQRERNNGSNSSDIACSADYRPVCGKDGKTYSNACNAKKVGVAIAYERACSEEVEE